MQTADPALRTGHLAVAVEITVTNGVEHEFRDLDGVVAERKFLHASASEQKTMQQNIHDIVNKFIKVSRKPC